MKEWISLVGVRKLRGSNFHTIFMLVNQFYLASPSDILRSSYLKAIPKEVNAL